MGNFKGKNSSNVEYDLFADFHHTNKFYYDEGDNDYYPKIENLTRYINKNGSNEYKFEGTLYRDYFKNDP